VPVEEHNLRLVQVQLCPSVTPSISSDQVERVLIAWVCSFKSPTKITYIPGPNVVIVLGIWF